MVLRLLILKHIRNWSYGCWSARCGPIWCIAILRAWVARKTPDAKTMGRWGLAVEPAAIKQIHERYGGEPRIMG